ncbi:MAG: penicillin-binding protein 2 [Defluviicoccus sp.]|nr:penicillin-binding protein 2 [Defluviicoccus sp.]MDG4591612.1 penicillin-binding protein 2 [Defluviicoccus sp.]MDS4012381.1 penicillin-binding protein 2 [Defluviicoccus sp.]MDS4073163.1 penicillin-binding protein 2 [Defluviicoccus sp.]
MNAGKVRAPAAGESRQPASMPASAVAAGDAEGLRLRALETARDRLLAAGLVFVVAFLICAGRLVDLGAFGGGSADGPAAAAVTGTVGRGDIVDRNGVLLATSLPTASLFADPKEVLDPRAASAALAQVFPSLDRNWLLSMLTHDSRFVWLRRNLNPAEQNAVNRLGIPGLGFRTEYRRVYPQGRSSAHVLGRADIDEFGVAGIERSFDAVLANGETVRLSLDMRIQQTVRDELLAVVREHRAVGGAGVVLDVATGELLAMVSLPDFDPNAPVNPEDQARFNRVSQGVYEMGSVFKLLTLAMALDSGVTTLESGYDASRPLRIGHHTISDYHAKNRWLSVPEILIHSSNIGAALMAIDIGSTRQRQYLQHFGMLSSSSIDLPVQEVGKPLVPNPWRDVNTMTVGFGHGIAVTPLQMVAATASVVNGGIYRPASLLCADDSVLAPGVRVVSPRTSKQMRAMLRLVVRFGTGMKADVPGYNVGGKTGTAEKLIKGQYRRDQRVASFIGAFPMEAPRYVVFAMVDEPKGTRKTFNYATGGWVSAPLVGRIIARIAPVLGIAPAEEIREAKTSPARNAPSHKEQMMQAIREAIASSKGRQLAAN